jgi:hypothetical protein
MLRLRNNFLDPALVAYLKSLGVDPDYVGPKDDPRRVVIKELSVIFKEHPSSQTLSFATEQDVKNAKKTPLHIKEGTEYKMKIQFRVQHDAVAGFKVWFFSFNNYFTSRSDKYTELIYRLKTLFQKSERKLKILKCLEVLLHLMTGSLSKSQDKVFFNLFYVSVAPN